MTVFMKGIKSKINAKKPFNMEVAKYNYAF
jgi:hypothetical protein